MKRTALLFAAPLFSLPIALTACDDTIFGGAHGSTVVEGSDFCAVETIFEAQCLGCHSAGSALGGLDLETDAYGALVDQPSANYDGETLVIPNDSANSFLYLKCVGAQGPDQGDIMPIGAGLSEENAQVIADWIDDGASSECSSGSGDDTGGASDDTGAGDDTGSSGAYAGDWCGVQDVIDESCLGCHSAASAASAGAGYDLETDPYGAMVGHTSALYGATLVEPGDPEGSLFYRKCTNTQDGAEGSAMPLGSSGVSEDAAQAIYDWIADGADQDCASGNGGDDTGGAGGDDTDEPAADVYSDDYCGVQELFEDSCVSCHSAAGASGGLDLQSENVRSRLVGTASSVYPSETLVIPSDPEMSFLYQKSVGTHDGGQGGTMPLGTSGVNADAAQALYTWIADGASGQNCP